ncbi:uncharacterized protein DFL_003154 [Arthrobotrys flagrans]|uniref:Major facilitator superfamily (MFS) profile domain-containing protein n=1 Tax=Arthrobotrys flagrans TaxID=97331 RepID=A0A437A181_ARTFL|nr:hypothetical protein DFL_003154 [Arthrobotrys flagrans]
MASNEPKIGISAEIYPVHIEHKVEKGSVAGGYGDAMEILKQAREATEIEHNLTLWQNIRLYPKAIAWSVLMSTAIIMEGYDIVLIGSFYAFPSFNQKYGTLQPDGKYSLSAAWQSGLSNGVNIGALFGLGLNGIISERYGYRNTMMGSLLFTTAFISILFFAQNVQTLLVGEILLGIPLGVFQTLTVSYASEICPVGLRAYLTTYVNICWVIGQLLASSVLRALVDRTDQWSYRIPFGLQWIWPIPIFIGVALAPESPWWLVRKGKHEEAEDALARLTVRNENHDILFDSKKNVAMMIHTNEVEKRMASGTSYKDCFKGVDLRRTEIASLVWAIQNLCGAGIMGYSTYFYTQAGLAPKNAFNMSMAQYGIGMVGTISSWALMIWCGRRNLYIVGLILLDICLFVIGFIALAPSKSATQWATGSMLLAYTFFYDITIGPVCYSLVTEISSTRLRVKTTVLARGLYSVFSIVNGVIIPYMLNPTAWNWKGKAGFFWGGICFCCIIWCYFRLPEPKGRSYGELDLLFENKISARKFKSTIIDLTSEEVHEANRPGLAIPATAR